MTKASSMISRFNSEMVGDFRVAYPNLYDFSNLINFYEKPEDDESMSTLDSADIVTEGYNRVC